MYLLMGARVRLRKVRDTRSLTYTSELFYRRLFKKSKMRPAGDGW